MIIRKFENMREIIALDDTRVREFLNPHHDDTNLHLGYSLAHASLESGSASLPHKFKEASEVYYIIHGKGIMHIDDEVEHVGPGDTIYIPPKAVQWIESIGEESLDFLCIVDPAWRPEDESVFTGKPVH